MKINLSIVVSSILLCLSLTLTALPQTHTGTILGIAMDPNGAVIPGARITATLLNQKAKAQFETKSDENGEFRFSNLPFGTYELEMFEFGSSFKERVSVRAGGNKNDEVVIKSAIVADACSGEPKVPSILMTNNDKAEIVRQMLDEYVDAWVRGEQAQKLILSTDNIDPKWIDDKNKAKLQLMRQSDVQHLADTTKDFTYLRFSQLKVRGECVAVSLDNSWAVGKNSPYGYVSGEGKTHEFRKVNGRWIGKFVIGWIS